MKNSLGLSPSLSVTETVSNACAKLRIAPTGNVKNDAVSCYLALPPTNTASNPSVPAAAASTTTTTTTLSRPSAAVPAAPAGNDLVSRVRSFYKKHNPEKGEDEIAGILRFYVGRETELIRKLEKKYSAAFA